MRIENEHGQAVVVETGTTGATGTIEDAATRAGTITIADGSKREREQAATIARTISRNARSTHDEEDTAIGEALAWLWKRTPRERTPETPEAPETIQIQIEDVAQAQKTIARMKNDIARMDPPEQYEKGHRMVHATLDAIANGLHFETVNRLR